MPGIRTPTAFVALGLAGASVLLLIVRADSPPLVPRDLPAGLNWELFLGPVPQDIPYHPAYHPFSWRGWVPFGVSARTRTAPCRPRGVNSPVV